MILRILWPNAFEKGNPFGGVDGFRPIRITFHNSSFTNITTDEKQALDILVGLTHLDDIDAMSFDGSILPKIIINNEETDNDYIRLTVINAEGEPICWSGLPTICLEPKYLAKTLGVSRVNGEEKFQLMYQEILEAKSHGALNRDIFITTSELLLKNKGNLDELNICTPSQALKITGLCLRLKGEFEWISHIKGKVQYQTSRRIFYNYLTRGKLPNSWKYLSGLGLHKAHEKLIPLGWSVLTRYSRAVQALDEIGRLFYIPHTSSFDDQMIYHLDYLTILLTAALDAQVLIINLVYKLGLKDNECGIKRNNFKIVTKNHSDMSNINTTLLAYEVFINILFDLRNKIHSVSLETNLSVPRNNPDELLERIYQYNPDDHWGIQKQNVNVFKNRDDPIPSINYSVEIFHLAQSIFFETTNLINSLMEGTKIEKYLNTEDISKIMENPPTDMLPYIHTYLLLV